MSEPAPSSPDAPEGSAGAQVADSFLPPELVAGMTSAERPRLSPRRAALAALGFVAVIALLVWVLPRLTGTSVPEIAAVLSALPGWSAPVMALLGAAALLLEAVTVRTALPGSRYADALIAHAVCGATALAVPGGSAVGLGLMAWILRRAGLGLAVVLTGIIAASLVEMTITSVAIPVVGLGAYALSSALGPLSVDLPGALWAALVSVLGALLALGLTMILLRRGVLVQMLRTLGMVIPAQTAEQILAQRDVLVRMLRTRPLRLLGPTVLARAAQWAALVLAIRAVGAEVPLLLTVAIFALGRVLSLIPLTPGGAGITETVGALALVALGVPGSDAAAAMILLLVAMLLVPLLAGALASAVAAARRAAQSSS